MHWSNQSASSRLGGPCRAGSGDLNSFGAVAKQVSYLVMPPPGLQQRVEASLAGRPASQALVRPKGVEEFETPANRGTGSETLAQALR